jgi:hypothetical protein
MVDVDVELAKIERGLHWLHDIVCDCDDWETERKRIGVLMLAYGGMPDPKTIARRLGWIRTDEWRSGRRFAPDQE